MKQQTLQSFEFLLDDGDEEKFISYFTQNEPLLSGHLIILSGVKYEKVEEFLSERGFCYLQKGNCKLNERKRDVRQLPKISIEEALEKLEDGKEPEIEKEPENKVKLTKKRSREIIEKPVRSGTFIQTKNDLTVLSQINDGSEIEISGNLEVFGTINGKIICNGVYMLLRDIGAIGNVIFNGIILDKEKFKTKRAKIVRLNSSNMKLIIEEL